MFCPRCGRPVSEAANFCGGCGLPKAEIARLNAEKEKEMQTPQVPTAPVVPPVDTDDVHATITRLENDLNGVEPVMFQPTEETKADTDHNSSEESENSEGADYQPKTNSQPTGQSQYSAGAPGYDYTAQAQKSTYNSLYEPAANNSLNQNLSTVDYIWMMLISAIPFIGLFYMIYLAFIQDANVNKRSYARASLIIGVFSAVIAIVFIFGIVTSQIMR